MAWKLDDKGNMVLVEGNPVWIDGSGAERPFDAAAVTVENATLKREAAEKRKALQALEGIDPEKYKTLEAQAAKAEEERAIKAGEFDNLKKQLVEAHAREKATWEAEKAKLSKSLEENVLIATATQAIATEKGSALLLMPHVRSRTKLDDNGNPVVIDESGNVRVGADGKPLSIAALITEMKADVATFGRAFEASGASGSGSQQSNGNGQQGAKVMKRSAFDQLNPAAKVEFSKGGGRLED